MCIEHISVVFAMVLLPCMPSLPAETLPCLISCFTAPCERASERHVVVDTTQHLPANAFLNEPASPFPGWLVLNGGHINWCTLRGQEDMKHALVTSKVHPHVYQACSFQTFHVLSARDAQQCIAKPLSVTQRSIPVWDYSTSTCTLVNCMCPLSTTICLITSCCTTNFGVTS